VQLGARYNPDCLLAVWQRSRSLCCWWHGSPSNAGQYVEVIDIWKSIWFYQWCEQWLADDSKAGCQADVSCRASGGRNWSAASAWIAVVPTAVWLLHCAACALSYFSFQIVLYTCAVVCCECKCSSTALLLLLSFRCTWCSLIVSLIEGGKCHLSPLNAITLILLFWKFDICNSNRKWHVQYLSSMFTFLQSCWHL